MTAVPAALERLRPSPTGTLRVLHVQKVAGVGGAERHLLALLPRLRARGVDARMVVLATADAMRFVEPMRAAGVPTSVIAAGSDVSPRIVRTLWREIAARRPDLVHTHLIHADTHGQMAAWLAGVPGASSVHSAQRFYLRPPYRTAARASGHLARRTIAISAHVGTFLRTARLAPADRIRVVPYGIEPASWALTESARAVARERLGIAPDDFVVGFASRLIAHKGHAFLLEAAARVRAAFPTLRLLFAGDGPLRAGLETLAASLLPPGVVRFLGFIDDVAAFMNACDTLAFLTMPELSEGFGLAALEGMAAGRAVIATHVGALPEIVAHGQTGLLVEPGDLDELSRAILALGRDPALRARLGAAGSRRAAATFNVDAMVERTLSVYEEIV